jgi:hypothetical protein
VTISLTSEEGSAGSVALDMVYDATFLGLDTDDCVRSARLADQLDSVSFPDDQPAPPERRLRIGIFPPLDDPDASFTDGDLMTCTFSVSANAPIGTDVDLVLEQRLQVVRSDLTVVCGVGSAPSTPCGAQDGVVMIEQATPTSTPTSTFTRTEEPTNTPTSTPTNTQPTNTPTNTPTSQVTNTPTNTPTSEVTNTPTSTPTNTRPTNTPTNTPTREVTNTPTNTPTRQVTNTPTNTPTTAPPAQAKEYDDSCAIVPIGSSDPSRSLVLLLVPALLLWGRRRRF